MPNIFSNYDHFMVDNVLKRNNMADMIGVDANSEDGIAMVKILLSCEGFTTTEQHIGFAAEWIKGQDATAIRNMSDDSYRRLIRKEFRQHMNRRIRQEESKFMDHVGMLYTTDKPSSPENVFNLMKDRADQVALEERISPSEKSPTAEADIKELARRFATMGVQFQRPQGTSLHHFIDDLVAGKHPVTQEDSVWNFFKNEFQSFVIEHNWAKAFEGVKDFDGGEIRLPFAYTCFEFRINDVRVLIFLGENEGGVIDGIVASGINKRWYINPNKVVFDGNKLYHPEAGKHNEEVLAYLREIGNQIRAVCIMLDAKVAVGERRASGGEALKKKRIKEGKSPLRDYHVVSLARRHRAEYEKGDPTGIRKRLHWRRGHWRHFKTPGGQVRYVNAEGITVSKTWVEWHLVGDENLGFIEKHYRL